MPNMAFIGCKAGWNPTSKRSFSCRVKNNVISPHLFHSAEISENSYRSFFNWKEPKLLDQCGDSKFELFHGEAHPNAVAWTRSERHETVRVALDFVLGIPPGNSRTNILSLFLRCHYKNLLHIQLNYLSGSNVSGSG